MKKTHLLALVFLFFTFSLIAQSIERQLIGVAGANDSGKQILMDWTLGEPFISHDVTLLGEYKEGFLQPDNLSHKLNEAETQNNHNLSDSFSAQVFPNPFKEAFTFEVNNAQEKDAQITVFDYSGKILMNKSFPAGMVKIDLTMGDYPSGLYFLQFTDEAGFLKTSFKLLKL